MERRKAMATALAGAVTLGLGTVCLAAVGAAPMLGLAAAEQVKTMTGVTEVQMIDRVVVVRSGSTVPVDPAVVQLTAPATIAPATNAPAAPAPAAPAPATPAATPSPIWPTATQAPPSDVASSPAVGAPSTQEPATTAKATTPATTVRATTPATTTPTVAPVTTVKPVATTLAPTTTKAPTTTLPPGVPRDWPAGKPIPPMPPNCQQPQLELNGVWNCDN